MESSVVVKLELLFVIIQIRIYQLSPYKDIAIFNMKHMDNRGSCIKS